MNDELGSNIPPPKRRLDFRGHWVEYDLGVDGQPIKKTKGEEDKKVYGQLTKRFDSQFEAVMWLAAYGLQGRYMGEGNLGSVKALFTRRQRVGDQR